MAISDELPGVEVAVTVAGVDLKEHCDDEIAEEARTTTRYVEATSGQTFAIRMKVPRGFDFLGDGLSFEIQIDGTGLDHPLIFKGKCASKSFERYSEGVRPTKGTIRKYQFGALETVTDGHAFKDEASKVKDLGSIVVRVRHKRKVGRIPFRAHGEDVSDPSIISEKALKGRTISHKVGFEDEITARNSTRFKTELVPATGDPAATFVFHYRSYDALKSMLIIPRTPSPPPLEDRDASTLTQEEVRELQRRAKQARDEQEARIRIKREKREEEPRRRKVARPTSGATQVEIDDNGHLREGSTPTLAGSEIEVIELD